MHTTQPISANLLRSTLAAGFDFDRRATGYDLPATSEDQPNDGAHFAYSELPFSIEAVGFSADVVEFDPGAVPAC